MARLFIECQTLWLASFDCSNRSSSTSLPAQPSKRTILLCAVAEKFFVFELLSFLRGLPSRSSAAPAFGNYKRQPAQKKLINFLMMKHFRFIYKFCLFKYVFVPGRLSSDIFLVVTRVKVPNFRSQSVGLSHQIS